MGRFSGPLTVTKIGADTWVVEREFTYYLSEVEYITVPSGFETDFASVPWGLRNLFPKDGKYTQAAVLHDYLYNRRMYHGRSRKQCDDIFLDAMKDLGVNWIVRHTIHKAVMMGGGFYWRKK